MSAATCDYAGNGGYLEGRTQPQIADQKKRGAVPFLAAPYTQNRVKMGDIRDGTSNTFLLWESAGKEWYSNPGGDEMRRSWDEWHAEYQEVKIYLNENEDIYARCTARNSVGYLYAWAAVNRARARVWDAEGLTWGSYQDDPNQYYRVVNATNSYRSPYAFHPTICVVAMADGSVRTINQNISASVFIPQTTRWGSESVDLP